MKFLLESIEQQIIDALEDHFMDYYGNAGYILPDGVLIGTWTDDENEFEFSNHGNVEDYLKTINLSNKKGDFADGSPTMKEIGAIRINNEELENNYIELPLVKPTDKALDTLRYWLDRNQRNYPYIIVTTANFNKDVKYNYDEYTSDDIIKKIKRFYSSGVLYEKLNSNLYHAYHGSRSDFERFEYQYIGSHGLENGYGLYFADDKDVAQSYGDYIIEADLLIRKPFSDDEITITKDQTKEYIRKYVDNDGEGFLTDYGWYKDERYEKILDKAVDAMFTYNQSDNDIISEILPSVKNKFSDEAYDAIFDIFGKDGIIYTGYSTWDGSPITNYIVYSNNQVLNKRKIKKV